MTTLGEHQHIKHCHSQRCHMPTLQILALALALLLAWGFADAQEEYTFNTGDRVRVRVHERADISGEFDVRAPGKLSIPTLGEIAVSGFTPAAVEKEIADRLGLRPDGGPSLVSVQVVRFSSFYVLGDVRKPGAYEYVPRLFLLQAVAIAGGYRRIDDESFVARSEVARAEERLRQTQEAIGVLLAQKARLEAENGDLENIDFPQSLANYLSADRSAQVIADENRVRALRSETLTTTVEALRSSRAVFEEEVSGHTRRIEAADAQIKLIEAEIVQVSELRGQVAPKTFVLGLRRLIAGLDGEKGERVAFIARARQQIQALEQDIIRIVGARRIEILEQLKAVEDELARLRITNHELRRFLRIANPVANTAGGDARNSGARLGDATIIRRSQTGLKQIRVGVMDKIAPGDVITIPSPLE